MARVEENFDSGVLPANYTPSISEDLRLIGKIAISIIRDVVTKNPLSTFLKGKIDNGDTIEQAVVKLLESTSYDPNGENTLAPSDFEKLAVRYFSDWSRKKYKTTVRFTEMEKYLTGEQSAESIIEKLVGVLSQSDTHELYQGIKGLLSWGSTNGSNGSNDTIITNLGSVSAVDGKINYNGVLKKIKNTVDGMTFVNSDFNKAGILRSTNLDDIIIVMPYTLYNDTDVDSLSGFFNLDKAEIKNRIIKIDSNDKKVYILDRYSILVYTRLYRMLDQLNAEGAFYNYFLHVERLFAISPLFDSAFFTYEDGSDEGGDEGGDDEGGSDLTNKIRIVNNSSETVEMYYEVEKEEYGNTTVAPNSTEDITIDSTNSYYIRYTEGGSSNVVMFNGKYGGSDIEASLTYYDGNICPPNAIGSSTEWVFNEGDGGTITVTD